MLTIVPALTTVPTLLPVPLVFVKFTALIVEESNAPAVLVTTPPFRT